MKLFTPLRIVSYLILFLVLLAIFSIRGIDTEIIKGKLIKAVKVETGLEIGIGSLEISPLLSLEIRNVTIADSGEPVARFENVSARFLWLSLLRVRPSVRLATVSKDGFFSLDIGRALFKKGDIKISLKSRNFPIREVLKKIGGAPLPVNANLDADGKFNLAVKPDDIMGELEFVLKKFQFDKGILEGTILSSLRPESASCLVTLSGRLLSTKRCFATTPGGRFEFSASSQLADLPQNSPLSGSVAFKPEGSLLKTLLNMYQKYKKPDGAYHLPLKGTLSRPGFVL